MLIRDMNHNQISKIHHPDKALDRALLTLKRNESNYDQPNREMFVINIIKKDQLIKIKNFLKNPT